MLKSNPPYKRRFLTIFNKFAFPDSNVHGANIGPTWGRQDPGEPHVGPMNFAIWVMRDIVWVIVDKMKLQLIKEAHSISKRSR